MRGLIVDDSKSMRELLRLIVSTIPDVDIVATVETSEEAWKYVWTQRIDFMLLDLELPGKSGLELLEHCKRFHSIPTIVISARIIDDPGLVREACSLGAIAALPKPDGLSSSHDDLAKKIGFALDHIRSRPLKAEQSGAPIGHILAIGASTGGVTAVQKVATDVANIGWPVLITQHMSSTYTPRFAESLGKLTHRPAFEAAHGMILRNGSLYVAPGDRHMRVVRGRKNLEISLGDDDIISGHRPSIDAMFMSLADLRSVDVLGVILTGMGNDGANGMLQLHRQGCHTIAQDEESSTVFGMARAACALHAVDSLLPLDQIGPAILNHVRSRHSQAS